MVALACLSASTAVLVAAIGIVLGVEVVIAQIKGYRAPDARPPFHVNRSPDILSDDWRLP